MASMYIQGQYVPHNYSCLNDTFLDLFPFFSKITKCDLITHSRSQGQLPTYIVHTLIFYTAAQRVFPSILRIMAPTDCTMHPLYFQNEPVILKSLDHWVSDHKGVWSIVLEFLIC